MTATTPNADHYLAALERLSGAVAEAHALAGVLDHFAGLLRGAWPRLGNAGPGTSLVTWGCPVGLPEGQAKAPETVALQFRLAVLAGAPAGPDGSVSRTVTGCAGVRTSRW